MPNKLKHACAVRVLHTGGTVTAEGEEIAFAKCDDLTLLLDARTNYKPDYSAGWRGADPMPRDRTGTGGGAGQILRRPAERARPGSVRAARPRDPGRRRHGAGGAGAADGRAAEALCRRARPIPTWKRPCSNTAATCWPVARGPAACPPTCRGCGTTATTRPGPATTTTTSTSR